MEKIEQKKYSIQFLSDIKGVDKVIYGFRNQ
jgi:hypothetical protein